MNMKLFKKEAQENRRRKSGDKPVRKLLNFKPWLQVMTIGALMIGIAVGMHDLNQRFTVKALEIKADQSVKQQVERYLASKGEMTFWQSRAGLLQRELLAEIPDIESMEISRVLPDRLHIMTKSRVPIALWETSGGVMLVDESSTAYRALKRGENLDLPILRMAKPELEKATALMAKMGMYDDQRMHMLSEVVVEQNQWRFNFAYGEQWQFNEEGMEQNLQQVMHILTTPRWAQGHWRMDARIPQRWFIRPAKQEVI